MGACVKSELMPAIESLWLHPPTCQTILASLINHTHSPTLVAISAGRLVASTWMAEEKSAGAFEAPAAAAPPADPEAAAGDAGTTAALGFKPDAEGTAGGFIGGGGGNCCCWYCCC
jgi:hypothetical protein